MKDKGNERAIYFKTKEDWREWLSKNFKKEKKVWIGYFKKGSGKAGMTYNEGLEEALCFGWIDGLLHKIDEERYILRYTPRNKKSIWSKINKEKALRLIKERKMTEAGFKTIEEAKKRGVWEEAYSSRTMLPIPDFLKEALLRNREAWQNFNNFANSYKNNYIGWVLEAKTEGTREKRVKKVVTNSLKKIKPGF